MPDQTDDQTNLIWKANEINLGEWCFFVVVIRGQKMCVFGLILGFQYLTGKTKKEQQYSRHFAPTKAPAQLPKNLHRGIGALSKY